MFIDLHLNDEQKKLYIYVYTVLHRRNDVQKTY